MLKPAQPLWFDTAKSDLYPTLSEDLEVDVAIIGGGITGLTAAALLVSEGKRVALLEMHQLAVGETGHTTSHLTELVDAGYHAIESKFGRDGAAAVAESQRVAIERIATFVQLRQLSCGFERVPAFVYAEDEAGARNLEQEVASARRAGLEASLTRTAPVPFPIKLAMRVENQAQIDPRRYLLPLARSILSAGGLIYTNTRVVDVIEGSPCEVLTEGGRTVRAKDVFVAAHNPFVSRVLMQTKLFNYRTYVVAGPTRVPPPPGLYWDTADPYHYTRTQKTHLGDLLIVGGEDHKTGAEHDTEGAFNRLADYARARWGLTQIDYRWSGQIIEPTDGLPFIGTSPASKHLYIASGYSGTGMTFGTLAGMMVSEALCGRSTRWTELYSATRFKPLASAKDFVTENLDFPTHLIADRVRPADVGSVSEVPPGEGRLVSLEGRKVAVFRDQSGLAHALSPVCKHLGCHVGWNNAEKSWDCPCHGGRYDALGHVINGPPTTDLSPLDELLPGTERRMSREEVEDDAPVIRPRVALTPDSGDIQRSAKPNKE